MEAERPAAAAAGAAADGEVAQQGHYNEVAENYETGKLVSSSMAHGKAPAVAVCHVACGREEAVPLVGHACPLAHQAAVANGGRPTSTLCLISCAAFFYSSIEYRDWVLGHLLRHFGLPDEARGWRGAGRGIALAWHLHCGVG